MKTPHSQTEKSSGTPRRALVVDSKERSGIVEHVLEELGFESERLACCDVSYSEFAYNDYPLVFFWLDSVCDAAEFARVSMNRKETAFIGLSEKGMLSEAIEAIRLGMKDYFILPDEAESLPASITEVFEEISSTRQKNDIMCMMTHDLKIPLSSIIGYSDILFDQKTKTFHSNGEDFVRIIKSNGLKMLNLIDNFLMSSSCDNGWFSLQKKGISVRKFIDELVETFKAELECHHLEINVVYPAEDFQFFADDALLFRAIGNVLSNACKYAPPYSQIEFRAFVREDREVHDQKNVVFEVTNEGEGLSEEDAKRVFEKFHRGGSQGCIKGCGIGMYVMKSIVESHGGKVFVKSVPNHLTTFSAELPMQVKNAV